ncbi:hypothetical protein HALO32_02717 [Halomonas lysinitropha]|uniref:Uncharacterized protein n=1 Tax=Halomonas lysinitropha TaxID=2607506 RepID=A0A5K1I4P8_9GAMM|nr:hypothetical protein HALO32_02717 [Halomonas lysinitropha]
MRMGDDAVKKAYLWWDFLREGVDLEHIDGNGAQWAPLPHVTRPSLLAVVDVVPGVS